MKTFIVEAWSKAFGILGAVSLFALIRKLRPNLKSSAAFVEWWVICNLIASAAVLVIQRLQIAPNYLIIAILVYAAFRIFEVVIYQINVLLFDQYRIEKAGEEYQLKGYRRLVILSLQNYVELLFWFSSFYYFGSSWFTDHEILSSILGAFYLSLVTMSTLGYGDITPNAYPGYVIVVIHTSVGVFMTLMIIARFISLLPKPDSIGD